MKKSEARGTGVIVILNAVVREITSEGMTFE